MTIAAIILAAGESTRMGRPKQLLPWSGMTLVAWQVQQMRDAGVGDVVVVLGHAGDEVHEALPDDARSAFNASYTEGRASSLRAGAEALPNDTEAVLILSVDQPRPAWLSRRLIERWRESGAPIVSPRFGGGYGHPILVAGALIPQLREVDEATLGLRAVIDRYVLEADAIDVANQQVDVDLNTPDDYERAQASFERGEWEDSGMDDSDR